MASFTETAYYARKAISYAAIGLVVLIFMRLGWGELIKWWKREHPPPPPPPTLDFGILPRLTFPADQNRSGLSFQLETITNTLPDLGSQAAVYFMPSFRPNVLGLDLATDLATKLGFSFPPQPKDEQVYIWRREGDLSGTLTINLVTGHFFMDTDWYRDTQIKLARSPAASDAIREAKEYLRSVHLLPPDLEQGDARVEFLQAGVGVFTPAISQSEANLARVHLFRSNINSLQVVRANQGEGVVQVVVSGVHTGNKQIISITYQYSPVELERHATYPLRATQEAWERLITGEGVVVKLIKNTALVIVRDIELAYYDADTAQEFMQPVYVFKGDNGFVAYISAIDPKWIAPE